MQHQLTDATLIEQRLLELAYTTDAKITAPALAYFAPCSIDDAGRVLDDLAAKGRLEMNVEDDGSVVYEILGRERLAPRVVPPPGLRREVPARAMVVRDSGRDASPMVAAILSAFVPGAGHLYAGRIVAALLWFLVVGAGYALILPGLVLHLFSIVSAASAARRLGAPSPRLLMTSRTSY